MPRKATETPSYTAHAPMIQATHLIRAALAATVVLVLLPAAAGAEYLIPDDNSAVNQYTEGVPSAGGDRDVKGPKGNGKPTPQEAIGAEVVKKLEKQGGDDGSRLAEVTAETAPTAVAETPSEGGGAAAGDGSGNNGGANGDMSRGGGGKAADKADDRRGGDEATAGAAANGGGPDGSSGLGEVASTALGSSNGGLGPLLPLILLAALLWGGYYAWRQRSHPPAVASPQR